MKPTETKSAGSETGSQAEIQRSILAIDEELDKFRKRMYWLIAFGVMVWTGMAFVVHLHEVLPAHPIQEGRTQTIIHRVDEIENELADLREDIRDLRSRVRQNEAAIDEEEQALIQELHDYVKNGN